jgi:hypothetical protein
VLIPLVAAVGVAVGIMFPRISRIGPPPKAPPAGLPSGVRVEELESGEALFEVVGQEALVLKYSGGDVKFWVELETDGKKQKHGEKLQAFGFDNKAPDPSQLVEGYFVWLRAKAYDDPETGIWTGKERWTMGVSRALVSTESSGVRVASPLVQGEVVRSKEDRDSSVTNSSFPVQVWKGHGSRNSRSVRTSIPTPLPPDREVCLKTITEESKEGEEIVDHHVIRVMCKVEPLE